jgi:hypothetical protein
LGLFKSDIVKDTVAHARAIQRYLKDASHGNVQFQTQTTGSKREARLICTKCNQTHVLPVDLLRKPLAEDSELDTELQWAQDHLHPRTAAEPTPAPEPTPPVKLDTERKLKVVL